MSLSKVTLKNGAEFELVTNAVVESATSLSVTFLPGDYTVEGLETVWAGNDVIKVTTGDTLIKNYTNYTKVKSVEKINDYVIITTDEEGNEKEETIVVCTVTVVTPDINDRMTSAEDSIEDIINTIL